MTEVTRNFENKILSGVFENYYFLSHIFVCCNYILIKKDSAMYIKLKKNIITKGVFVNFK